MYDLRKNASDIIRQSDDDANVFFIILCIILIMVHSFTLYTVLGHLSCILASFLLE